MRTTVTLDDDVFAKVKDLCTRTGESFRVALNRLLRAGLLAAKPRPPRKPFRVKARSLGLQPGVQLDNVAEILEQIGGPGHP